jgi:hypothetical protein
MSPSRLLGALGALCACATASADNYMGNCDTRTAHYENGGWFVVLNRHPVNEEFVGGPFVAYLTYVVRATARDGAWLESQFVARLYPWDYSTPVGTRYGGPTVAIHVTSCRAFRFAPENSVRLDLGVSGLPVVWRQEYVTAIVAPP